MEWILESLASLQIDVQSATASTSSAPSEDFIPSPRPEQLNDYVHVIHDPLPDKRPSVEIVFFHGLQFERSEGAYLKTWLSKDGTQIWIKWILDEFADARILVMSYDAAFRKTDSDGTMEMFTTGENLVSSLIDERAQIGQDGCPVLLVGHCLGGLVMKEICLQAHSVLPINPSYRRVQNFLNNIKGLFYYATPNHGTEVAEISTQFRKGHLVKGLSILNKRAARRNYQFSMLRKQYCWKALGVGEGREITLGAFKGYFVVEASARNDVDTFYTVAANHFDVCRPDSKTSSSFHLLMDFVRDTVEEDEARQRFKIHIPEEVVGVRSQIFSVRNKLRKEQRLAIIGIGGIGKTTLANAVYTSISVSFEYACFLEDVKEIMSKNEKADDLRAKIIGNLCWRGHL
ncbi:unnamed protein product [Calypogeia fissa]